MYIFGIWEHGKPKMLSFKDSFALANYMINSNLYQVDEDGRGHFYYWFLQCHDCRGTGIGETEEQAGGHKKEIDCNTCHGTGQSPEMIKNFEQKSNKGSNKFEFDLTGLFNRGQS